LLPGKFAPLHRRWQEPLPWRAAGRVYLKLTVIDDVLVVSFKEL